MLAHLGHPLVDMSARLLRAAVWSRHTGLHRVTAVVSDDPALESALAGAYSRFVLVGKDGIRLHEEILYAGGWLREDGTFRRVESLSAVSGMLDRALTRGTAAAPAIQARLAAQWARAQSGLITAIERRTEERLASLTTKLAAREEAERRVIITGAARFEATLRRALAESEVEEDALFSVVEGRGDEREIAQWRRDRENWQAKLDDAGGQARPRARPGGLPLRRDHAAQLPRRGDLRRAPQGGGPMSPRPRTSRGSRREAHIEWLKLIDLSGPFLSVPVLTAEWPDLEPLDGTERDRLRRAHGDWQASGDRLAWIGFVLEELLGWQGLVRRDDMDRLALPVAEHEAVITPSFTLNDPASGDSAPARHGQRRLPGGAGARLGLAGHPRGPAGPAVPRPRRRAGAGDRRPMVGSGVGPGRGSHHGGRLRQHLVARFIRTDGGPSLHLPASAQAVVRRAGGSSAPGAAPGVTEAPGRHHRGPRRPGPPGGGTPGRGVRPLRRFRGCATRGRSEPAARRCTAAPSP